MRKIAPNDRRDLRMIYAKRVMNGIRAYGFASLTIQDLACFMKISRASLYNYFSSKEDILIEVINLYTTYLEKSIASIGNDDFTFSDRIWLVYEQNILSSFYLSEVFLLDLKASCPALYERIMNCKIDRMNQQIVFYESGMKARFFNMLNPAIIVMQNESVLRDLFNSDCLITAELSIKNALSDYYVAKCTQIVQPKYLDIFLQHDFNKQIRELLKTVHID